MSEEIRVLSNKEQARTKINVWHGSSSNWINMIKELSGNSLDIFDKNKLNEIKIIIHNKNKIEYIDSGSGIPVEGKASNGIPNYEAIFEVPFAGSKYNNEIATVGCNGVFLFSLSMTCKDIEYFIARPNGNIYNIAYHKGDRIKEFNVCGKSDKTYSRIIFSLDEDVWNNPNFTFEEIKSIVKGQASLSNVKITLEDIENGLCEEYYFENGIEDYFKELTTNKNFISKNIRFKKTIEQNKTNEIKDIIDIDLLFNFSNDFEEDIKKDFLNTADLIQHGTIYEGIINGFKNSINTWLKNNGKYDKNEKTISNVDIENGLNYICDTKSLFAEYVSQVKQQTLSPHYEIAFKKAIEEFMNIYFIENEKESEIICNQILINKRAREKSELVKRKTKEKLSNEIKFTDDIKNFKNCISTDKKETELFLCEGSSAQGGMLQSRDEKFQACFHVGGKMLSLLKANDKQIFSNEVVYNLYRVFGCGTVLWKSKFNIKRSKSEPPLPPFNINNFRWSKVILSTDQDIDAYQIRCLILTAIYKMSPQIIENGMVYIAEAPLFEITTKEKKERTLYAYTDLEKDEILKELYDKNIKYYPPDRNKGLGQMDVDTRAKTMMIPETRRITKVTVKDVEKMNEMFELWLGDDIEPRKNMITNNFNYVEHFDVESEKDISKVINENYLPYAIDIVKNRAIISIDGFKPAHRKLLWTLHEKKLYGNRNKSANIVGDNMHYNVHGDGSIYETLVRLAQSDSLLYPYVNGKGNFGLHTHNGKELQPAHMRYTDAGASDINKELFDNINKNSVEFIDNYDGTLKEPKLLPTSFPNLLVNYNDGIAVGMASKTPSFNLEEVCDLTIAYIKNKNIKVEDYLLSPDLATGGEILYNLEELKKIYSTGKGSVILRAKYIVENNNIIIKEIPYSSNVESIIEKIKELCKSGDAKYNCITNVLDTTGRKGMSITITVKNNTDINKLMKLLFKNTPLQSKLPFNMNIICLDGIPRVMGIKSILDEWIKFRKNCIINYTKFDLNKNKEQLHLLYGLKSILTNIDKAIEINQNSENIIEDYKNEFNLDKVQSEYVYDMKLRYINKNYITNEIKSIKELENKILYLEDLINNNDEQDSIIIQKLIEVKNKFGMPRKTEIIYNDTIGTISKEELIEDYNCNISVSREGYIKKYSKQTDNNKVKDGDEIIQEFKCNNKDMLFLFTNKGNRIKLPVNDLDLVTASKSLGSYIPTILSSILPKYDKNEQVIKVISIPQNPKGYILNIYEDGKVSKVNIDKYMSANKSLANCYSLKSPIVDIQYINKDCDILLISSDSKGIIFNTSDIAPTGTKNSQGITGIKLNENEKVIYSNINLPKNLMITATLDNNKTQDLIFNDIAPTGRPNEQRDVYGYIYGKRARKGYNLFNKNIINVKQIN